MNIPSAITIYTGDFAFHWQLADDRAKLTNGGKDIWEGPLLPSYWLQMPDGQKAFVKGTLDGDIAWQGENAGSIPLRFGEVATGQIDFRLAADGLRWERQTLDWTGDPLPIIESHIGAMELTDDARRVVATLDKPHWPGWFTHGYAIPSGKTAPLQSFMRRWDPGRSRIALGSFAPSMGSPYGAAYPRPVLAAALGGNPGWMVVGAPGVPDGAMSLLCQAGCACLEFVYREDLWGAVPVKQRVWENPLKLVWAKEAIDAYCHFYRDTFAGTSEAPEQLSMWNTWGDFRLGVFNLPQMTEFTRRTGHETLVYDDCWETMNSSAEVNYARFPDFDKDLVNALALGLKVGFWQSVGWIDRPEEVGLTKDDLLCGLDGEPRQCSWSFNPLEKGPRHFALDPSSARTREFIVKRIQRLVKELPVSLIKVDFNYGLPGPEVAVPRDPKYRGERMGVELIKILADAAHAVRPDVVILGYTFHPALLDCIDMVALDDLGDAAGQEIAGHGQWSFWAVLAGWEGLAVNGSSGYDWAADTDVMLNSVIIGAPGGILPLQLNVGPEATARRFRPRRAISRFYRRTKGWKPLWLNSEIGGLEREPTLRCWGRLETFDGQDVLTALALRDGKQAGVSVPGWPGLDWAGNWALLSQDNASLANTATLACVPLGGTWLTFDCPQEPKHVMQLVETPDGDVELPCDFWEWKDGLLALNSGESADRDSLLAVLIHH